MNSRTAARFMALLPLFSLAGGCNTQKPITFRLSPATNTQERRPSDLDLPAPHLSATPSRWEYKVVKVQPGGEQELTKFLNELGRDGWEFAGQLQTKENYLVLRRPKQPRDYIRSSGDLTQPDALGKSSTGKISSNMVPLPPFGVPLGKHDRSSAKKDTKPTGLPRLREKPGN